MTSKQSKKDDIVCYSLCSHEVKELQKHHDVFFKGHDGCVALSERNREECLQMHHEKCPHGDRCFNTSSSNLVCQRCHYNGTITKVDGDDFFYIQEYKGKYNVICMDCSYITKNTTPIITYVDHKNVKEQIWCDINCKCGSMMLGHPGLLTTDNKCFCISCKPESAIEDIEKAFFT